MALTRSARFGIADVPIRTWAYLGVAVALVAVFVWQETAQPRRSTIPVSIDGPRITRIVAETPDGRIELVRSDEQWVLGAHAVPADQDAIAELVDLVSSLGGVDVVTARGAYADYGLAEDTRRLRFFTDDVEPLALELGDGAATGAGVYARVNGSPEIVVVPSRVAAFATLDQTRFRSTTVAEIPEDDIASVVFSAPGAEPARLERVEADTWGLASGAELDEGTIGGFFQEVGLLRAADFPPLDGPAAARDIAGAEPVARVEIERVQGPRAWLEFYAPAADESEQVLAATSESDYPFYLATWRVRRLLLGLDRFLAPFE